jgi:hypothetical protein
VIGSANFVAGITNRADSSLIEYAKQLYVPAHKQTARDIVIDFEGEMLGHGGFLVSGALRFVNDTTTCGLLIDMEYGPGIDLMRCILENVIHQKILWGAESDCCSLLHQKRPRRIGIRPENMYDIQLRFSEINHAFRYNQIRRLSLKKALDALACRDSELLQDLPEKDCIDWNAAYEKNHRVLTRPLGKDKMSYALDDLCRIETVIQRQDQLDVCQTIEYTQNLTDSLLQSWINDPNGIRWFWNKWKQFKSTKTRHGERMMRWQIPHAIVLLRHVITIQNDTNANLSPSDKREFAHARRVIQTDLKSFDIHIPEDLSFAND